MAHVVKVPDIGEGIAEVELVAWHVKAGDDVAEDQKLADVMTDKATVEIPSPLAGRVLGLGGEVGQMLAVGAELLRIEAHGAAASRPELSRGPLENTVGMVGAAAPVVPSTRPSAAPQPAAQSAPGLGAAAPRSRPIASPAVRARAWELGIALERVTPSGSAGRVMQADLDAYLASGAVRSVAAPAPVARSSAPPAATRDVKIVGLRRRIAQRMQESKRRIPHFTYVEEVDVTELEALRTALNAKAGTERTHLTLLPFLIRAIVLGVPGHPQVNSRFDDEAGVLTQYSAVHAGVATQTDAGLMVPVVRDAQQLDLWTCAAEIARLAAAARGGKAVRDELSGSTITVTSLGRHGGIMSTPVINPPEVAIVGVNAIKLRPVFQGGALVARLMMNLSASFDHRVVDGAVGAAFIQGLRERLEHPAMLFIEGGP
jgi:2-oxoisovalerate dehydrogenase E2 component (dihydrolipoyl transacylase)